MLLVWGRFRLLETIIPEAGSIFPSFQLPATLISSVDWGLEPLPDWFVEGERHWDLVPLAREVRAAEERQRAYQACPKCFIDRDYARPLRRNLMEELSWLDEETEMTLSFDGRVLSISLYRSVHEVVASGDSWPSSYNVIVSPETKLPDRFMSTSVAVSVFEGYVRFDRLRLGPYQAVA